MTFVRFIVIVLLALLGIVGLGMSLCGGMITFAGLFGDNSSGEFRASSMLVISVPSLLIGLAFIGFVGWRFKKWAGRDAGSRWRDPRQDRR